MNLKIQRKHTIILHKIRSAFNTSIAEHKLMLAIIEAAIHDLYVSSYVSNRKSAIKYLSNEIVHAEICGVDSDWIRRIINTIDKGILEE